ncbi:MAG: methyltransferase domain-containing protein [Phycisphaerales bacterium]
MSDATTPPSSPAGLPGEYVLGTDQTELVRLGIQHRLWGDAAHALWRRANLVPGERVLDIGCGPGYAARDLAMIVGDRGRVVGIDESEGFVREYNRRSAEVMMPWAVALHGDVQRLDAVLEAGGESAPFDLAYSRWVMCFVPDPEAVVRAAAKAIRPGGRWCIQDYFAYSTMTLAPKEDAFTSVVQQIDRSWRDRGGDPDIVGRLPAMLERSGFRVTHLDVEHRIARPGDFMWTWPDVFWSSVLPRLVASRHITAAMRTAFEAAWSRASADPTRFCLLPPVFEVIAERV